MWALNVPIFEMQGLFILETWSCVFFAKGDIQNSSASKYSTECVVPPILEFEDLYPSIYLLFFILKKEKENQAIYFIVQALEMG